MDIRKKLRDGLIVFDGAMGTMLQSTGLKLGELPEVLNINSPDTIVEILYQLSIMLESCMRRGTFFCLSL